MKLRKLSVILLFVCARFLGADGAPRQLTESRWTDDFQQYLGAIATLALLTASVLPQKAPDNAPACSSNATPNPWAFSLITSGYIVPGGESYVWPDFSADRGWLHLEARYNDEALRTGSM